MKRMVKPRKTVAGSGLTHRGSDFLRRAWHGRRWRWLSCRAHDPEKWPPCAQLQPRRRGAPNRRTSDCPWHVPQPQAGPQAVPGSSPSPAPMASRISSPNGAARSCYSICGQPGARPARWKCLRWTGFRPSWAGTHSPCLRSASTAPGLASPPSSSAETTSRISPSIMTVGTATAALRASGLPVSVILDGQGREVARLIGPADWDSPTAIAKVEEFIKANGGKG